MNYKYNGGSVDVEVGPHFTSVRWLARIGAGGASSLIGTIENDHTGYEMKLQIFVGQAKRAIDEERHAEKLQQQRRKQASQLVTDALQ